MIIFRNPKTGPMLLENSWSFQPQDCSCLLEFCVVCGLLARRSSQRSLQLSRRWTPITYCKAYNSSLLIVRSVSNHFKTRHTSVSTHCSDILRAWYVNKAINCGFPCHSLEHYAACKWTIGGHLSYSENNRDFNCPKGWHVKENTCQMILWWTISFQLIDSWF
jgi:hypothetical protein